MKKLDPKNAEVTKSGIKVRGSPAKGSQKTVVVRESSVNKLKKNILYFNSSVMAATIGIGLAIEWTPEMVHIAYPLGGLYIFQMLLLKLTKVE